MPVLTPMRPHGRRRCSAANRVPLPRCSKGSWSLANDAWPLVNGVINAKRLGRFFHGRKSWTRALKRALTKLRAAPQQRRHLCKPFGARDLPRDNVSLSLNVVKCGTGGTAARDAAMPNPCDPRLTSYARPRLPPAGMCLLHGQHGRVIDWRGPGEGIGRFVADRFLRAPE
jgi:hypothetical protein